MVATGSITLAGELSPRTRRDHGDADSEDPPSSRGAHSGSERDALLTLASSRDLVTKTRRLWVGAVLAGISLATAAAFAMPMDWVQSGRRSPPHIRSRHKRAVRPEAKAEIFEGHCFMTETDIDYDPLGLSNMSLDHIPFPEMCCAMCHGIPSCAAWVWKKDPTLDGCQYKCWVLADLPPFRPPVKMYEKLDIVSGLPPPRPAVAPPSPGAGHGEACAGGDLQEDVPSREVAEPPGELKRLPPEAQERSEDVRKQEARQAEVKGDDGTDAQLAERKLAQGNESSASLFCFSLIMPIGYEIRFLVMQYELKASIFACDQFAVYTNKTLEIVPQVITRVVDSTLSCGRGGDSYTALNSWIFIAVWYKVISDRCFEGHDWTVKVDADAVFFPDRLRAVLGDYVGYTGYLNNCGFGMHGPVEVLSRSAVKSLAMDYGRSSNGTRPERCVHQLPFGLWGEDMFLDQCLSKVLGVPSQLEPRLLCESNCNCPDWFWCKNGTDRVSYHPFKREDMYKQCMANAMDSGLPIP